jgi:hypothetical protein
MQDRAPYGGAFQPETEAKKDVIRGLLSEQRVAYHPQLARLVGGVTAGLFLAQLMYWSGKGDDPDGWIWKTQVEWEQETAMTRREQETARRQLRSFGVLEEKRTGQPARLFFRILWDTLIDHLQRGSVHSSMAETANLVSTNPPDQNGGNRQSLTYTENTTETTKENENAQGILSQDMWPEWFALGHGFKGWVVDLATAEKWRIKGGYSEEYCLNKVHVVRSQWKENDKRADSYAVFQRACREDWGGRNGYSGNAPSRAADDRTEAEKTEGWGRREAT